MESVDVKDDRLIERISRSCLYASRQFEKLVNKMTRREFER